MQKAITGILKTLPRCVRRWNGWHAVRRRGRVRRRATRPILGPAEIGQPRDSFAGGRYYTDGLRAVLFFLTRPRALSDVEVIDWVPALDIREAAAAAEHGFPAPH